jgi:hypothetical protein
MSGDVGELTRAVAGCGDRLAVAHHDRADRNLAAPARRFRLAERDIHEASRVPAHLASAQLASAPSRFVGAPLIRDPA